MEKFIPLRKLLEKPKKYGITDAEKLYIEYVPDINIAILDAASTGYNEKQIIKTATYLNWHPIMHRGMPYLVSKEGVHRLFVGGAKATVKAGKLLLEKGKELYSNSSIGAEGSFMTASLTLSLPDWLKDIKQEYLLASEPAFEGGYFSLEYMDKYMELRTFDSSNIKSFPLRPCVKLKKDTMVNVGSTFYNGSTPERAIRLSLK